MFLYSVNNNQVDKTESISAQSCVCIEGLKTYILSISHGINHVSRIGCIMYSIVFKPYMVFQDHKIPPVSLSCIILTQPFTFERMMTILNRQHDSVVIPVLSQYIFIGYVFLMIQTRIRCDDIIESCHVTNAEYHAIRVMYMDRITNQSINKVLKPVIEKLLLHSAKFPELKQLTARCIVSMAQ